MKKWMRRAGYVVGGLVGLVLLAAAAVYIVSSRNLARTYAVAPATIAVPRDSAAIARGHHLARAITKCVECHGDDLSGKVVIDDPAIGRFVAPNLTTGRGGVGATLTVSDWEHAIRHGVARDGKSLKFMPAQDWATLNDDDLAAIIAWATSVPAVDHELPPLHVGPVARALNAVGQLPLPAQTIAAAAPTYAAAAAVTPAVSVEYGRYLANVGGCTGCHGPGLSGGHVPGTPPSFKPAANITPAGIGPWTEADFFRALREGVRPGGTQIDSFMPWKLAREMTDDEIRALYAYLRTVPPREFGQR